MRSPGIFVAALVGLVAVQGCTEDPTLDKVGGTGPLPDARATDGQATDAPVTCDETRADAAPGLLPCDVEAVLAAKCQRCHNSKAVLDVCFPKNTCLRGPFPLLTWSDTHQIYGGKPIFERMHDAVASGFMPFQSTDITPPTAPLEPSEKTTLLEWTKDCAPEGRVTCGSDAGP